MLQSVLFTPSAPAKGKILLSYRGVTYKVPKNRTHRLGHTSKEFTALMGKELMYRGVRYKLTSPFTKSYVTKVEKRLRYRGVAYTVSC